MAEADANDTQDSNNINTPAVPSKRVLGWVKLIQWMLVISGLLMLLAGLGTAISIWHWSQAPIAGSATGTESHVENFSEQRVRIEILPGQSAQRTARELANLHVLQRPEWFVWWLRWQDQAHLIRAGEYDINPQWTPLQLRDALLAGANVRHPFTIVPGETLAQVRQKIRELDNVRQTLSDEAWLTLGDRWAELGVTPFLEGWLLPETYFYQAGESDWQLVERAVLAMVATLNQAWLASNEGQGLPLKSPYEALILASIIEKETGVAHEREMISGVFVRRLQRNMRLQTDPTVIYGMGDAYQGRIGRAGLDTPTPYNTYIIRGLPPTPIAMPSAAAVVATVNPDQRDYLFFVAKGGGAHHFSVTLEEHNRAVRRYILNRN